MSGGHVCFTLFYKFRTSKDLEILRQSSYMSHILKGLSKRNTHIPHIVLFDKDKWQTKCSNAYFGVFRGGGHFWRVTQIYHLVLKWCTICPYVYLTKLLTPMRSDYEVQPSMIFFFLFFSFFFD